MITINTPNDCRVISDIPVETALEFRGLSTDKKPEVTTNGSTFLEIDTGNVFCFDKENGVWIPW